MYENFLVAVGAVSPLAVYLGIGLFMRWYAHFDDKAISNFNKLIFTIFLPMNMFASIYYADTSDGLHGRFLIYAIVSLLAIYGVAFLIVPRIESDNRKRGVMIQAFYRSNLLLLGVPIVENIYGSGSTAITMVLAAFSIPLYNIMAVFCLETFRGGSNFNILHILKGVLKNPMIMGAILGVILRVLGIPLPEFLAKSAKAISVGTTPLALMVLGASFTVQAVVRDIKSLVFCVIGRLILAPAMVLAGAILLGFRTVELASLMSMSISPCAIASYVMAQQMDADGELAGNAVIFTTAISLFTMFLWIFSFKNLGWL